MVKKAEAVKMLTSLKNRSSQAGLTLTELLISVGVLSLIAGISTIWLNRSLPSLAVKHTADLIEGDLKHARLFAKTSGSDIIWEITQKGYQIPSLKIERVYTNSVKVDWQIEGSFFFSAQNASLPKEIIISKGNSSIQINIDPYTNAISR